MKKFLFVALSFLFASSAFGFAWGSGDNDAKGSMQVKVVNDGNTDVFSWQVGGTVSGIMLQAPGASAIQGGGTLAAGDRYCKTDSDGKYACTLAVNTSASTLVTVRVSGKATDFNSSASGSGSTTFEYSGTGVNVTLRSKTDHGLIFLDNPKGCESSCDSSAPTYVCDDTDQGVFDLFETACGCQCA